MIIAILATAVIFMGMFILVLVVGYNEQLRSMRMKANINAGLWAEAEAKAHDAEIQVAKLDGALKARISAYEHMWHLAREAIKAAGEASNIEESDPKSILAEFGRIFQCTCGFWQVGQSYDFCPACGKSSQELLALNNLDEILNATEIDS